MVPNASAVVLVLDRLGSGYLGPYGNTWIDTPAFNRLASQSLLVEYALVDTPCLDTLYRSYWHGGHAMCSPSSDRGPNLSSVLHESGITTVLLADEALVVNHDSAVSFDERLFVEPKSSPTAARELNQTQLARLLTRAIEWLSQCHEPFLLWIHSRAMNGPWDAPHELRLQFADEGDPEPPDFVNVPSQRLESDYDPDELLGIMHAYAGQVTALDRCLGAFMDAMDHVSRCDEVLLSVTSSRGFPLGEHLRVGDIDEVLYSELLQVPFITRFPNRLGAAVRSQSLWQPRHLHAALLDWFGCPSHRATPAVPGLLALVQERTPYLTQRACTVSAGQRTLRTPAWLLRVTHGDALEERNEPEQRFPHASDDLSCELFVKPDDRWDVNNVADRCPTIVNQMIEQLSQFQQTMDTGTEDQLPALPQELVERPA